MAHWRKYSSSWGEQRYLVWWCEQNVIPSYGLQDPAIVEAENFYAELEGYSLQGTVDWERDHWFIRVDP
jgi:hypothetical protein